ncbi:MAG: hypothetical protein RR668_11765, partial [Algoriella sp.]
KSIQPKNELINAKSSDFRKILTFADNTKTTQQQLDLSPTLFDVLITEYISFLNQNDEKTKGNQLRTDLISIHQQNNNENAVLYNELILLDEKRNDILSSDFIKQKEILATKYPKAWYSAYVYAALATDLYNLPNDKLANVNKIFDIQQKVAKLYPTSSEKITIDNLIAKIKLQEINLEAEKYINENKNTPIKLSHKNLNKVFVKVLAYNVGFDDEKKQVLNVYDDNRVAEAQKFLNSLQVVEQYSIDVKSFDDFQFHSTIVKLNPLKTGRYIVLFSYNSDFIINKKDEIDYLDIMVSKYAINPLNEKLSIVNRESGKPEANVSVEVVNRTDYDNKESKTFVSDKNGMIQIPSGWRNFEYRIKDENTIYSSYFYENGRYKDEPTSVVKIFTDRAIYRPGQTVYFKGIFYTSD